MNLCSVPLQAADMEYVEKAQAFARDVLAPNAETWEREKKQPAVLREMIAEFTKLYVPKELGGLGASKTTICRELEELAWADYGATFAFEVHNHVTMMVAMIEDDALRSRYLAKLMSGEMIGAFLLTEPGAGSDASSIQCRAVEEGDHYILNGEKAWVTNAGTADLLLVFAQTGTTTKDIISFLVERTQPGVNFKGAYEMVGAHAAETGVFAFENCVVPKQNIAFGLGDAFKKALGAIDFARFAIAAMCNGAYKCGLETAVAYAKERIQFGKPILKNQGLQWKLANELTNLEASRMLTFLAAKSMDDGQPSTTIAAHCKKYAVQAAFNGVNCAMQCMGSNGLNRKYPLARQITALAITYNTDGTNDICNLVIGRTL